MQAMILRSARPVEEAPLEALELPTAEPAPDQVRIQIRTCGICHTDLHIVEGEIELPRLPVIPGHQIVGMVEAIGTEVTQFQPGDRVGVPWLYSTCQACRSCRRKQENLCDFIQFTGYHVDGGFAQYVVISESFVHRIPEKFSDEKAAPLLCGGVIGYRALRLSEVQKGERLGLYGFGASAHLVIQIARHWDCEVYVFTRSAQHRQLAEQLGAVWVGLADDEPPQMLDSAIIFAPAGYLVPAALRVLRKGGTLALAGIFMSPIPEMPYSLIYQERKIKSVANSTRKDVQELLLIASQIPLQIEVQTFPLKEANQALQLLKKSQIQGAGILQIYPT